MQEMEHKRRKQQQIDEKKRVRQSEIKREEEEDRRQYEAFKRKKAELQRQREKGEQNLRRPEKKYVGIPMKPVSGGNRPRSKPAVPKPHSPQERLLPAKRPRYNRDQLIKDKRAQDRIVRAKYGGEPTDIRRRAPPDPRPISRPSTASSNRRIPEPVSKPSSYMERSKAAFAKQNQEALLR